MSAKRKRGDVEDLTENTDPNVRLRIQRVLIKKYKCQYCPEKFVHQWSTIKHELLHEQITLTHPSSKPIKHTKMSLEKKQECFESKKCDETFANRYNADEDSCNRTNDKPFQCYECGKKFDEQIRLDRHKYIHWNDEIRNCIMCSMEFYSENELRTHERIHAWIVSLEPHFPFEMDHSHMIFQSDEHELIELGSSDNTNEPFLDYERNKKELLENMNNYDENPIEISDANTTSSENDSQSKMKTENHKFVKFSATDKGIDKLAVKNLSDSSHCKRKLSRKVNKSANQHKNRTKVGVNIGRVQKIRSKNNQCNECKKNFSTPGHLDRHKRIHTDERPFQCGYCDKTFYRNYMRNSHERSHNRM